MKLIKPVMDYIQNYQRKQKEHLNKMKTERISKKIFHYQPRGQMKRWEENMRP